MYSVMLRACLDVLGGQAVRHMQRGTLCRSTVLSQNLAMRDFFDCCVISSTVCCGASVSVRRVRASLGRLLHSTVQQSFCIANLLQTADALPKPRVVNALSRCAAFLTNPPPTTTHNHRVRMGAHSNPPHLKEEHAFGARIQRTQRNQGNNKFIRVYTTTRDKSQ